MTHPPVPTILWEDHASGSTRWPTEGRHILAQFDAQSIVVYQAYRPEIAAYAVEHQRFGGEFSYGRMSWIKPNFLWMMLRCGWAAKPGQERVLALRLPRDFFDSLLLAAVPSTFDPARHASREAWQEAVAASDVRLQWDPDHDPSGAPVQRPAVQLGLRGAALRQFGQECLLSVEDITEKVVEQRPRVASGIGLQVPSERVYMPSPEAARAIGLDSLVDGA